MSEVTFADAYREQQAATGLDACPIEAGLLLSLADNECPHGKLPTDRVRTCTCWEAT